MTLSGLKDFILKRMLVAYLTLIPSVIYAVISQSSLSIGIFIVSLILVLVGTWIMFGKFEEERLTDFTKKLEVLLEQLEDKITNPAYIYSLPSIALEIARNKEVLGNTKAWDKLLTKHSEDLTNNMIALSKRIESDKKQFRAHLREFCQTLTSTQKFKKDFYDMFHETRHLVVYYSSSEFKRKYDRVSDEYNRYMDKVKIFSDDVKANFSESLEESMTEHIKGFNELFPSAPISQPR